MKERIKNNIVLLFIMFIAVGILAFFMHIIINTNYYTNTYYKMKNYQVSAFVQGIGRAPCVTQGTKIVQKFTAKSNSLNQIGILFLKPYESIDSNVNVKLFEEKTNKKILDENLHMANFTPDEDLIIVFPNQKFSKNKEYRIEILGLDGQEINSIQFPYACPNKNVPGCIVNDEQQENALVINNTYAGMLTTKEQCILFAALAIILAILILVFDMQKYIFEKLELRPKTMLKNIISNWYLIISVLAFYMLNIRDSKIQYLFLIVSSVLFILATSQFSSKINTVKNSNKYLNLYCLLSTFGICFYLKELFSLKIKNSIIDDFLLNHNILLNYNILGIALALISSVSIFLAIHCIITYLIDKLKNAFTDISKKEWIFYGIICIFVFAYVIFVSVNTTIPYGASDILFTSDSGGLVNQDNAYLNLYHAENDMRQPLFAFLAIPFIGIGYTISLVFPNLIFVKPLCMNLVQMVVLLGTTIILSRLLNLNSMQRILFTILSFCTYTFILFAVMMEQYVISYFWLITCIYLICNEKQNEFALSATSGTLLTGIVLIPFINKSFNLKDFKQIVSQMTKCVLVFVVLIIIFNRIDILEQLFFKERIYESFLDENITIIDKTQKYTEFVKNCYFAPQTTVIKTEWCDNSFRASSNNSFNIIGILLIVLAVLGFALNNKNKLSQICMYWMLFGFVILAIIGWGIAEDGLMLYSLYFGWPFLVLILQLLDFISNKLKVKHFNTISLCIIILILIVFNTHGLLDIIKFGFEYCKL